MPNAACIVRVRPAVVGSRDGGSWHEGILGFAGRANYIKTDLTPKSELVFGFLFGPEAIGQPGPSLSERAIDTGTLFLGGPLVGLGVKSASFLMRGRDAFSGIKQASQILRDAGFSRRQRVQILQSFEAGTVQTGIAGADQFGIRFFGGKAKPIGSFLFDTFTASRQSLALLPGFNLMRGFQQFQIRPGATVISGRSASQGPGFEGGQIQRFVLSPKLDLILP